MEKKVLIVKSSKMDTNKKQGRQENALVRISKAVRGTLGDSKTLEFSATDHSNKQIVSVKPFMAYSSDLTKVKSLVNEGQLSPADLGRICFVTTETFKKLTKNSEQDFAEVFISDTFKDILIGTDPELLLMSQGKVVPANLIAGMDKNAKFGSDGPMAELRPEPAYTPEGLVENIASILKDKNVNEKIIKLDWMSTCYFKDAQRDYPVGTHIHFDNPRAIRDLAPAERVRLFAVTNRILDELLSVPMIKLDGELGHNRRAHCKMAPANGFGGNFGVGYGYFGDWREASGRLEYRTLSGLVITNPELCKAVFGTAKAICEAVYKEAINFNLNKESILPEKFDAKSIYATQFNAWSEIPLAKTFGCTSSSKVMRETLDKSNSSEVNIKDWLIRMREWPTYGKYADHVESLGAILKSSQKALVSMNKNIKENWGI